jgi:serine/threonine/tyrosine protein kinase RAD53
VKLDKGKSFMIVNGDVVSVGLGVDGDEIKWIVTIPRESRKVATTGVNAHFEFGETIGRGAFAVVRKAIERETGKLYAVKIINKSAVNSGIAVARETEILHQLQHKHIVGLHRFFEDSQSYYLIMDYVGGGDLMDFVLENGPIPEDASREVVKQVLLAVDYVHGLGISHRDIKPDNILIAQDSPVVVKVSDFGLAKIAQTGTFLKTFCGTLAYLAPEVLAGGNRAVKTAAGSKYSALVDIWSIGCLAYVILTGYLPFDGATQEALHRSVKTGQYNIQPLKNQGLTPEGMDFICRLLTVDPTKRPSASECLNHPWIRMAIVEEEPMSDNGEKGLESLALESPARKEGSVGGETAVAPAPELDHDSDVDSSDVQARAGQQASQQFDSPPASAGDAMAVVPSARYRSVVRDIDAIGESAEDEYPIGTYMKLATLPNSIPFKDICIKQDQFKIGRVAADINGVPNDVSVNDPRISKTHCEIVRNVRSDGATEVWLMDKSSNGCWVNRVCLGKGKKLLLQDGDQLLLYLDIDHKTRSTYKMQRAPRRFDISFDNTDTN